MAANLARGSRFAPKINQMLTNPAVQKVIQSRKSTSEWLQSTGLPFDRSLIAQAAALDTELHKFSQKEFLTELTSGFKHVKYVRGQEDAVGEPDFAFFRKIIRDPVMVDMFEEDWKKLVKEKTQLPSLPKNWDQMEGALLQVFQNLADKGKSFPDEIAACDEQIKEINLFASNLKQWTAEEMLARKPEWADMLDLDVEQGNWKVRNDHDVPQISEEEALARVEERNRRIKYAEMGVQQEELEYDWSDEDEGPLTVEEWRNAKR